VVDDVAWPVPERFSFEGQEVRWGAAGRGAPLVLVHGTPFSSVVWRRIAPHLARQRRVYWYDLLGYGRSEKRAGQDVSLGVQHRVLGALLDHWAALEGWAEAPEVLAHDFGGATALRAHLLDGRDYRWLLLVDPVALSPHGSALVQAARRHPDAYTDLPPYVHEAAVRAYVAGAAHSTLAEPVLRAYVEPWLGETGQPAFYRQIAQMSDVYTDEIQDRYAELRCPVRLIWGADDAWIPLERGRELAGRMPGVTLHEVPGAGHLVQEDRPEAIVAAALEAIADPAPRRTRHATSPTSASTETRSRNSS
jgi:pimeloyl-ACP methyl ester carboxylesterase